MQTYTDLLGLVDTEAERNVLGTMKDSASIAMSSVPELDTDDFEDPRNKVLFHAMRYILIGVEGFTTPNLLNQCRHSAVELYPKQKEKPVVTEQYIESLPDSLQTLNRDIKTLKRHAQFRRLARYSFWLVNKVQTEIDIAPLIDEAIAKMQELRPKELTTNVLRGVDTLRYTRDMLERRKVEREAGTLVKFGWPKGWFDWAKDIRGLRPGMVGVLAAPDGVGKSMYLDYIAENWALEGHKVVLVHLEDNHEYKLDRRLCRHSRVPLQAIEDSEFTEEQFSAVIKGEEKIAEFAENLSYLHKPDASMSEILRELEILIDEGECDCAVLDYIDKCMPDKRQEKLFGSNQYIREGDDMNQFKNFCEKHEIVGFTATQGNKEMQGGGVKTRKQIDGSGKKSQRAQLVIIVTREIVGKGGEWYGGRCIAKEGDYSPFASVRIDKQNRGKTKTFYQLIRGEFFIVDCMPDGFTPASLKKDEDGEE